MVREQSIKLDFLSLKRTISGSELKTAIVVHYGAIQWMRLMSVMPKIAYVHQYSLHYFIPFVPATPLSYPSYLCCAQLHVYFKKYFLYDHSDQPYLSLTICSTTFHLTSWYSYTATVLLPSAVTTKTNKAVGAVGWLLDNERINEHISPPSSHLPHSHVVS